MRRLLASAVTLAAVVTPFAAAPSADAAVGSTRPTAKVSLKSLPAQCQKYKRVFCASQSKRKLWYVNNGQVVGVYDARFGSRRYPTVNGTFKIYWKRKKHYSHSFHADMPNSMFFDRGRAIHFSAHFVKTGWRSTSHGCINLRDYRASSYLFAQGRLGDPVVVTK